MKYYLHVLNKYATFSGRARRSEYWYYVLFNIIFAVLAMMLDRIFGTTITIQPEYGSQAIQFGGYMYFGYALLMFIPGLAVSVRRLHDIGKSGWFFLVVLIPFVGAIWLLVLFCTDSNIGDNEYGPNPKNIGNNDEINEIGSYLPG